MARVGAVFVDGIINGILKIKLVRMGTGQPPGGLLGLGRFFIRYILGAVTFGAYTAIDLLFPLWDQRRQTIDDKFLSTVVVQAR